MEFTSKECVRNFIELGDTSYQYIDTVILILLRVKRRRIPIWRQSFRFNTKFNKTFCHLECVFCHVGIAELVCVEHSLYSKFYQFHSHKYHVYGIYGAVENFYWFVIVSGGKAHKALLCTHIHERKNEIDESTCFFSAIYTYIFVLLSANCHVCNMPMPILMLLALLVHNSHSFILSHTNSL